MRLIVLCLSLALLLAACRDDERAEILAGSWLCAAEPPDYALERSVTYSVDGSLSGRAELESTDDGEAVSMQITFSGRWQLSGDTLTEEIETQRLMRFARDGTNVPLAELPPGFIGGVETALAGRASTYVIERLTDAELVHHDSQAGVETVCERLEA